MANGGENGTGNMFRGLSLIGKVKYMYRLVESQISIMYRVKEDGQLEGTLYISEALFAICIFGSFPSQYILTT